VLSLIHCTILELRTLEADSICKRPTIKHNFVVSPLVADWRRPGYIVRFCVLGMPLSVDHTGSFITNYALLLVQRALFL
jgi:hypothetical protein